MSGIAYAANGVDPVSAAVVEVWSSAPSALPRGVLCESCTQALETPLLAAVADVQGRFTINLDTLPKQASYVVTLRKARFRRIISSLAINACGQTSMTAADSRLPRTSSEGDLPKMAISSGTKDHLEKVVKAMGITEFDCVKGVGTTSDNCSSPETLGALLADPTLLATYGLLFISCSPGDKYEPTSGTSTAAQNLRSWVSQGGKLVVTDDSYDFVEQAFPDAIDFMGTSAAAGTPQPANTAEVGTAAATLAGTVSDAALAAWLRLFPSTIDTSDVVQLNGFLSNWGVQRAAGAGTRVVVHGNASYTGGSGDVPLTSEFEVNSCGRVIYSSYHTDASSTSGLLPQERVLEYLLLEVETIL